MNFYLLGIILLIICLCFYIKQNFILQEFTKQIYINDKISYDQQQLLKMLEVTHTIFENNNVWYIIYYGTLLGAVRHWGFIPWDNDIDLICTVKQKDHILSLNKDFKKFGYELTKTWSIIRVKPINMNGPNIDIFLFDEVDGDTMRCAVDPSKKEKKKKDIWEIGGNNCNYLGNSWWSKPSKRHSGWANNSFIGNIYETQRVKYSFEDIDVYGPEDPVPIIEGLYGKNALKVCKISHTHDVDENGNVIIDYSKETNTKYDCSKLPFQIPV